MALTRLLAAALLGLACARAPAAEPATPPAAFRVQIEAPSPLDDALRDNLNLLRWQRYDELTDDLLERLLADAPAQAREIAATRGYFSPEVEIRSETGGEGRLVRVVVVPGEPTRVREVRIEFTGAVLDSADGAARMAAVRKAWLLPAGDVFTQKQWEAAKGSLVAALAAERYAAAGIASSQATIDPVSRSADLHLVLTSGPPLVFGEVEITGLIRHSEPVVRNLSPIRAGEPYSRERLEVYQRRLIATNYFASVHVMVDADAGRPQALPVKVAVIEAPNRKVDVGAGYSTDTLFNVQLDYRDVNFLGSDRRLTSTLRYETRAQSLVATVDSPPNAAGWFNSYSTKLEATQIEGLDTQSAAVWFVRKLVDERDQPAWGLGYLFERQEPTGLPPDDTYALIGSAWYTWRRTDNLLSPRRGWNAGVQLSAAPSGVSSRGFGRAVGKLAWFIPLARDLDGVIRAEGGAVLASTSSGIPQGVLFRTGGDTTVRGYAFDSLGVQTPAAVLGGRYYAVTSAEAVYWAWENLGIAAFVDAGNAVDDRNNFKFALGYGLGGRVRTPAGPLRFDVAYGQDTKEYRIHFSFGLTF